MDVDQVYKLTEVQRCEITYCIESINQPTRDLECAFRCLYSTFDDRYAMAKKSRVLGKSSKEKVLIFVDTRISLNRNVGLVERSLHAKKQIIPFVPFDRNTDETDRHGDRVIANTRASIASRGKNSTPAIQ